MYKEKNYDEIFEEFNLKEKKGKLNFFIFHGKDDKNFKIEKSFRNY